MVRMKNSCLGPLLFLVAAIFSSIACAQGDPTAVEDACAPPDLRTDVRPDADGPPTKVSVGMLMVDLLRIDDVNQTLTGDFAVLLRWTDPRLAHLKGCELSLDHVWSPGLLFLNSGRMFPSLPREVDIGPDGQVAYLQRYFGTLSSYHHLRDFPFDIQRINISLIPSEWSKQEVQLLVDEKFTGKNDLLNISDWNIGSVEAGTGDFFSKAFDRFHARYDFTITASRIRTFYLWKIILPVSLIVAMSWCVFWLSPTQFGTQIGLSATSMLTLIAFIFATTNMVPALGYFTLLDLYIGGSTILVFLALIESVTTSHLVVKEKEDVAMRIDRVCRFVFPLSFTALLAALALRVV